jgi:hypothetical protein
VFDGNCDDDDDDDENNVLFWNSLVATAVDIGTNRVIVSVLGKNAPTEQRDMHTNNTSTVAHRNRDDCVVILVVMCSICAVGGWGFLRHCLPKFLLCSVLDWR